MDFPWAICLAREDAASLAGLRLTVGIEVGEAGPEVWLRGRQSDEQLKLKLLGLPARGRYEWLPADRLRQTNRHIPSARLPDLNWQPLAAWLRVESPVSALPAIEPGPVQVRLARSADECEPELLLARLEDFAGFVARAALVRLERLRYAATADGRVLVRGMPLPPLPGRRFVLHDGVAVPAGFAWQPAVSAAVLTRCLGGPAGGLVLWNEDGTITRLHSEQFVPVTRSGVRVTASELGETG